MYWIEARGVGDGVSGDMLAPELAQSSLDVEIRHLSDVLLMSFLAIIVEEIYKILQKR